MTSEPMLQPEYLDELFASFQLDEYTAQSLRFTPPAADAEVIAITEYLQPDRLLAMIEAAAKENKVEDLRVAAAVSNKLYHWVVLPGVLSMMSLAGIGLDASAENASLIFKNGELQSLWLHNLENTAIYPPRFPSSIPNDYTGKILNSIDELYAFTFAGLFQNNISILIDRVHTLTKVSRKTLWGNAANTCAGTYEDLSQCSDSEAVHADYHTLLEQPHSPVMPARNPLYRLMKREILNETGLPNEINVRSTCCLYAFIPPYTTKCSNCPMLQPEERIAMLKAELAEVS
jgi:ferric iron reductase protein FhuF